MICTFESTKAYYANFPSLPEDKLLIVWDSETGILTQFQLLHGSSQVEWFLSGTEPSVITQEGNYFDVNLRINLPEYEKANEPPHVLKGKIMVNSLSLNPPGGVFAAIWEGTGAAWYVADGKLTRV
jgi:hypothetical protein